MEGKKFEDRACCEKDGIAPSSTCPQPKLSGGAIAGIVIGSLVGACFGLISLRMIYQKYQKGREPSSQSNAMPSRPYVGDTVSARYASRSGIRGSRSHGTSIVVGTVDSRYEGVSAIAPPTAPPLVTARVVEEVN